MFPPNVPKLGLDQIDLVASTSDEDLRVSQSEETGLIEELQGVITSTRNRDRIKTLFTKTGTAPSRFLNESHVPGDIAEELREDLTYEKSSLEAARSAANAHERSANSYLDEPPLLRTRREGILQYSELNTLFKNPSSSQGVKSARATRPPVKCRLKKLGLSSADRALTTRASILGEDAKRAKAAEFQKSRCFARGAYADVISTRHRKLFAKTKKETEPKDELEASPPSSAQLRQWYEEFIPQSLAYSVFDVPDLPDGGNNKSLFLPLPPPRPVRTEESGRSSALSSNGREELNENSKFTVHLPAIGCHGGGFRYRR